MKVETKVGLLFVVTVSLVVGFAYVLGAFNPFSNSYTLNLTYNFAGGIEVGSPVRVMGIKVGKVQSISFHPEMKDEKGNEVKLKVVISVSKKAWNTIKQDSRFYINLAGVIGEKFIEITPGSAELAEFPPGATIRGEDPPRIDQLISQSYGLAGKILEMVERNEGSVVETIQMINQLVTNLNALLKQVDKTTKNKRVAELLDNIIQITGDVAAVSGKLRSEDTKKTIDLMHRLVWRLEELDKDSIRKFLQNEGIRAKIF